VCSLPSKGDLVSNFVVPCQDIERERRRRRRKRRRKKKKKR